MLRYREETRNTSDGVGVEDLMGLYCCSSKGVSLW